MPRMATWLFTVQMNFDRWLAVVGIAAGTVIGIVGIVLAIYYARRAEKKRLPTFVVSPKKVSLSSAELYALDGFKVTYKDAVIGKSGLTETLVHFFNSGNLPILTEEVLTPFEIEFPFCHVLECSVIKQNRDVTGLTASIGTQELSVLLDFALLEPNDGGTVRIVYDGPAEVGVQFKGSCIGASSPTVLPSDNVYFLKPIDRIKPFLMMPLMAVVAAVAGLILVIVMAGGGWLLKLLFGQENVGFVFGVIVAVIVIGGIGSEMYRRFTAKGVAPNIH